MLNKSGELGLSHGTHITAGKANRLHNLNTCVVVCTVGYKHTSYIYIAIIQNGLNWAFFYKGPAPLHGVGTATTMGTLELDLTH